MSNSTRDSRKKSEPIRVGKHIVGRVHGDTFEKRVQASRHFLRTPPAIALDVQSLADAEKAGALRVEILDTESKTRYKATVAHILRAGFAVDRGFGRQIALPLDAWIRQRPGEPTQLNLFK
jgi:hypothetical protein